MKKRITLIILLSTLITALTIGFMTSGVASANGSHTAHTSHTAHVAHTNHNRSNALGNPLHHPVARPFVGNPPHRNVTPVQLQPLSGSPTSGNTHSACGAIGHVVGSSQQVGCVQSPRPQFGVIEWIANGAAQSPVYNLPSHFTVSYICDSGKLTLSIYDDGTAFIGGAIEHQTFTCDNALHMQTLDLSQEYSKAGIYVDRIRLAVDRTTTIEIGE